MWVYSTSRCHICQQRKHGPGGFCDPCLIAYEGYRLVPVARPRLAELQPYYYVQLHGSWLSRPAAWTVLACDYFHDAGLVPVVTPVGWELSDWHRYLVTECSENDYRMTVANLLDGDVYPWVMNYFKIVRGQFEALRGATVASLSSCDVP